VNLVPDMASSKQCTPVTQYDAVVVGAGPYGLSTAAHLIARGLRVAVFGKTLELWRNHMPKGMLLRSDWWATNLSDPGRQYGFERFFRESKYRKCFPVPREAFVDYGLWFQERAVPHVDETYVSSIQREGDHFVLTLEDDREVQSAVVMAIGVYYYAHRPEEFGHLPRGLASHSCQHNDLRRFKGQQILVVGGGASGTDYAALLHEAGASVHVVTHRPILWFGPDRTNERTIRERSLAPNNGIAPGWPNWILEHVPFFFNLFPRRPRTSTTAITCLERLTG
jgi:cation diffusion facilitator CzcD-associated flavoprotein CzcO